MPSDNSVSGVERAVGLLSTEELERSVRHLLDERGILLSVSVLVEGDAAGHAGEAYVLQGVADSDRVDVCRIDLLKSLDEGHVSVVSESRDSRDYVVAAVESEVCVVRVQELLVTLNEVSSAGVVLVEERGEIDVRRVILARVVDDGLVLPCVAAMIAQSRPASRACLMKRDAVWMEDGTNTTSGFAALAAVM